MKFIRKIKISIHFDARGAVRPNEVCNLAKMKTRNLDQMKRRSEYEIRHR